MIAAARAYICESKTLLSVCARTFFCVHVFWARGRTLSLNVLAAAAALAAAAER